MTDETVRSAQLAADRDDWKEVERITTDLLVENPSSESARILWKKARRAQGKPLTSDLPLGPRKEIYFAYCAAIDAKSLFDPSFAKQLARSNKPHQTVDRIARDTLQEIKQQFRLSDFELDLILQEGRREAWPIATFTGQATPVAHRTAFRDSLACPYCSKRNRAPFWPQNADVIPFFYRTFEQSQAKRYAFRLPVDCPFCAKIWFVEWEKNPDELAGQFFTHIERISSQFQNDSSLFRIFTALLSDDVVGRTIDWIRENIVECVDHRRRFEITFDSDPYRVLAWLLPVNMQTAHTLLPAGYLYELDRACSQWNHQTHFLHWIFCFENNTGEVNLTFLPAESQANRIPMILASELLNPEELGRLRGN